MAISLQVTAMTNGGGVRTSSSTFGNKTIAYEAARNTSSTSTSGSSASAAAAAAAAAAAHSNSTVNTSGSNYSNRIGIIPFTFSTQPSPLTNCTITLICSFNTGSSDNNVWEIRSGGVDVIRRNTQSNSTTVLTNVTVSLTPSINKTVFSSNGGKIVVTIEVPNDETLGIDDRLRFSAVTLSNRPTGTVNILNAYVTYH